MTRPRKHDDLFDQIAGFRPLIEAARNALLGERGKPGAAVFAADMEKEVLRLERELFKQKYRPGRYKKIEIHDPKHRIVSAAPFLARVVHHALYAVIGPIFESGFIPDSYANRVGKGTHRAVDRYEEFSRRFSHVLRCDIFRYFPAIDHTILKGDIRRRLSCPRTLWLCDLIIDGSNAQEPVNLHFGGDDLFAPYERRRGLPIGNSTSQFFANLYLDRVDHFVKEVLQAKGYVRYADDFTLFHDDPLVLADWQERLLKFLDRRRLRLHPQKTEIRETTKPAVFLGYEMSPGKRRLPEDNIRRFRNRLRGLGDRWRAGMVVRQHLHEPLHTRGRGWRGPADRESQTAGDREKNYRARQDEPPIPNPLGTGNIWYMFGKDELSGGLAWHSSN